MSSVFCNQCGHQNAAESAFCASCGAALEVRADQTLTLAKIDPLLDAPGADVQVAVGDLAQGQATLIVRNGPTIGQTLPIDPGVTTLGRHPDSAIVLDDITVSRRHAEIVSDNGSFSLRDLGSLNGTYVNAARVEHAALHPGDELQVGKFRMLFYVRGDA